MFGAGASRAMNSNFVASIVNTVSAIIPIAIVIPLLGKKGFAYDKFGIVMAILGGISVALFVMTINKSFQVNKVALVSPLVFGGAIFLSAILSFLIFKEKLSTIHIIGLVILAVGLLTIIYSAATGK